MKKIVLSLFTFLLLIRCEEVLDKINYIEVTVKGKVAVLYLDVATNTILVDEGVAGVPVKMSLIKDGGERVEETGITDNSGKTSITATFKLYKEQPIAFKAIMEEEPFSFNSKEITWEQVDKVATGDGVKNPQEATMSMNIELLVEK